MNQAPNLLIVIITVDELKGMIDNSVQSVKEEIKLLIVNAPIPTSDCCIYTELSNIFLACFRL